MKTHTKIYSSLIAPVLAMVVFAAISVSSQTTTAAPASVKTQRPDIVLIVVDDLNDWVGAMKGHPQTITPNMDGLAKQGVLFTNAHCNAPQCRPSRASLLSGLYPKSTGTYFNSTNRPDFFGNQPMSGKTSKVDHGKPIILHEHFLTNGYRVVSGGKIAHYTKPKATLDAYLPLQNTRGSRNAFTDERSNLWGDGGPHNLKDEATGDHKVAQWAIKQWQTESDKPLLMTVGFYRPHRPLNAPKAYFEKFPVEQMKLPAVPKEDDWADMPPYAKALARSHAHRKLMEGKYSEHEYILKRGGKAEWQYMVSSYLACVNYVDTQIGLFLKALKQNPRKRETMIILTSDHGWNLGEKGHWCKAALWKNTTNVPFIIVAPGMTQAGTKSKQPISLVDIYPTLCDMAGLDAPKHLEGKSILPLVKNPDHKRKAAYLSYGPENTAVQTERYRYIRYEDGSEELYDHDTDPHEWKNLANQSEHAKLKAKLKKEALQFQGEISK